MERRWVSEPTAAVWLDAPHIGGEKKKKGKEKKRRHVKKKKPGQGIESNPLFQKTCDSKGENYGLTSPGGVASTCYRKRGVGVYDCCVARCSSAGAVESSDCSHRKEETVCA